jgi:DeoR/GlpR family transcriptional regulator of sugar metabolism
LVIIGGDIHPRTGVMLGPYANEMLSKINVRRAVISVAGINERGYYNSSRLLVETERAMMQAADEVIVVADSTKFGHSSVARLCDLGEVQTHVVDHRISEDWRSRLSAARVQVLIAGETDNG